MWYLIIPPLVFLGSLWLLLLFLSRRTADPHLQERLAVAESVAPRHFLFIREDIGLKLLEKMTQRFKIFFLKIHNHLNSLSQSIRDRRVLFQKRQEKTEEIAESETNRTDVNPTQSEESKGSTFFGASKKEVDKTVERAPSESPDAIPVTIETPSATSLYGRAGDSLARAVTAPLLRRRKEKAKRLFSEEDLIGKIAKNPKDAFAYEELGDFYLETEALEDAKACYRQVIKLAPLNREVKEKMRKLERLLTQKRR